MFSINMTAQSEKNYGLFGRVARRKSVLFKDNMTAWLRFAKLHLKKPQHFWKNVLWTDETKV